MKPKDIPDYTKCQTLFLNYLKSEGKTRSSKIEFTPSKKAKMKPALDDDDDTDIIDAPKVKRGRKPKAKVLESDDDNEQPESDAETNRKPNGDAPKVTQRRGRKPKTIIPESDDENEEPSDDDKPLKNKKRKSLEPAALTKVKKTKLTPKATPPAKKNHANIATQTSIEKRRSPRNQDKGDRRQVSFDSPICEIIDDKKTSSNNSELNSSEDMFEDSFVIEEKKVKPKRKLLSNEEFTVKKVVRKKTTVVKPQKGKSWKDCPTITNGRSPP